MMCERFKKVRLLKQSGRALKGFRHWFWYIYYSSVSCYYYY